MGVGGWPFGYEERTCWAHCPCNLISSFPTYVITIHQRYGRTDGQTNDMQSQGPTLHYSASRGKNQNISHLHFNHFTSSPTIAEKAYRIVLSRIAVQHAGDGYS